MAMPMVTSGSYVPSVAANAVPRSVVTTMQRNVVQAAPFSASSSAPRAMFGPMPTNGVMSGSYVPQVAAASAPPRAYISGSYVPPAVTSGSYTAAPMMACSGSYSAAPPMMAAPGSVMAPPMMLPVGGGSYCAAPPVMSGSYSAAPPVMSGSYSAAPPPRDLPNPGTVSVQKTAYKAALDKQYQQALAKIEIERDAKKQQARQMAQQNKDQFSLQARSNLEARKMELDTALNGQLTMLREAAIQHGRVLEEKAAMLTLDFQTKSANEDLMMKQYEINKQFVDCERLLELEWRQKQRGSKAPVEN